jgi:hypothetical protein
MPTLLEEISSSTLFRTKRKKYHLQQESNPLIPFKGDHKKVHRWSLMAPPPNVSLQHTRSGLSAPRGVSTDYVLVVEVRHWKDGEETHQDICYEKSPWWLTRLFSVSGYGGQIEVLHRPKLTRCPKTKIKLLSEYIY